MLVIFKDVWDYPDNRVYPPDIGEIVMGVIAEIDQTDD